MRALDLFCGGGGAAQGLMEAGFRVVGVDIERHKNYPGDMIVGDALTPPVDLRDFSLIWASPPCQRWSVAAISRSQEAAWRHPDLVAPTRDLLAGHPYTIIENVPRAPIRRDVVLTGPMMGLPRIERRRHFEISWLSLQPPIQHVPRKAWREGWAVTITKSLSSSSHFYPRRRVGLLGRVPVGEACEAMGISVPMTAAEVGEAVPPPYSRWLAQSAIEHMERNNVRTLVRA